MSRGACTVTVRRGPKVDRERCASLAEALDALERRARELERAADADAIQLPLGRRIDPVRQVLARVEVAPSIARRAGVDVRGDGSVEAYTGWVRRRVVEPRPGESPYDALRRAVASEP